jgi:hypothetical protein
MGFLALTPIKDWAYCGIIAAILIGGTWYHHKLITEGVAEQKAADDAASAKIVADTVKQTAELQTKATMAEQAYDQEQSENAAYRSAHPIQPVRLCLGASHSGSGVVPQTGAAHPGDANPGAGAANVSSVPLANSGSGGGTNSPDISNLLGLLAERADQVSAVLREYQSR